MGALSKPERPSPRALPVLPPGALPEPSLNRLFPEPPQLLQGFFEAAAARWPDALAVDVPPGPARPERRTLTYAELARGSGALAHRLRPRLGEDAIVAIHLARSTEYLYMAQLGALQAGGAYTCIEPTFPDEQVRAILADAAPAAILTDAEGVARLRRLYTGAGPVLDLAAVLAEPSPEEPLLPAPWQTPQSLAYLIYTSGTTGQPKGVMIEHAGVVSLVGGDLQEFGLGPSDRVGQGSAAAYDSSVEEIWLALAAGATVVVMDDSTARLGPDLIPWLQRERLTVFCPPPTLLRATGCEDPETALPDLKLLYVGGEALPLDLADRWARGRRMVNGYGPTECTVTALRTEVVSGQPVTIGGPIPGLRAWVLDAELREVPEGEPGELCLGGLGLARGYRHQPEVTAQKFLEHPEFGRIYRTGDLVHCAPDGAHHYHGRIDSQVKLRGYRIELEAIETRLAAHPGIRAAACTVQGEGGRQTLVAFVVPVSAADVPSAAALKGWVGLGLPAYMVPAQVGLLEALPTTVGGKLDRERLPPLRADEGPTSAETRARTLLETAVTRAFREALNLLGDPPLHADFFNDLGGDSLGAALTVSLLREDPGTAALTVRDLYEAPTIAGLVQRVPATAAPLAEAAWGPTQPPAPIPHPALALGLQTLWLLGALVLGAPLLYAAIFQTVPALAHRLGILPLVFLAPLVSALGLGLYTAAALAFAVLVKRLLIGRYRALRAPVWGGFYIRNWMVQRAVGLIPWPLLSGTELQCVALRALGARIGRRVHIHRGVNLLQGGWDLLTLGDDATLGQDAALRLVDLESRHLLVGPITLGAGATVEVRASLDPDTTMGEGACLSALSFLRTGDRVPAGELWHGTPAAPAGAAPGAPAVTATLTPFGYGWRLLALRLALGAALALPADLLIVALAWSHGWPRDRALDTYSSLSVASALVALVLAVPLTLAVQALLARALGPVQPGVVSRWSPAYLRVWLKPGLVDTAGEWLSGTLFWPVWLRLAGMRLGPGCEISTILDVVPELVEIGPETFFADGIYLGGPRVSRGAVTLGRVRLGGNTFLGNHAVIGPGQSLPDDVLLGVCTVADPDCIRAGTSWFGHPPFELPRREVVAMDRSLTHDPSTLRYLTRLFWELLRFSLPVAPGLAFFAWATAVTAAHASLGPAAFFGLALPLLSLASALPFVLAVLVLKWLLLGRVRPGLHPFWSCWCSRWDFLYVAWSMYARPLLATLEGTLWLTWYLRAMGLRVGHGAVLGPGFAQVVDPDMIIIGDGATVQAMFQAHTFEDRVLKIDYVDIQEGATLGFGTVPLYGAVVGAHASVAPHSVIMKRERLPAGGAYEGAPTRQRPGGPDR